jgi:hypothetical protein
VSFEKVKLTNNEMDKQGQVSFPSWDHDKLCYSGNAVIHVECTLLQWKYVMNFAFILFCKHSFIPKYEWRVNEPSNGYDWTLLNGVWTWKF